MQVVKEQLVTLSVGRQLNAPLEGAITAVCPSRSLPVSPPSPRSRREPKAWSSSCPSGHSRGAVVMARAPEILLAARRETWEGGRVPVAYLRAASCPAGVWALWRQPTLAAEMMRVWRRAASAPRHSLSARLRAVRSGCAPTERGAENGAAGARAAAAPRARASAAAAPTAGRPPAAQWSGGGGRAVPGAAAVGRAHRVLRAWLGPQHAGFCLLRRPQPAPPRPGGEEGAHPLQEVGGGGTCGRTGRGGEGRHRARRRLLGGMG